MNSTRACRDSDSDLTLFGDSFDLALYVRLLGAPRRDIGHADEESTTRFI